MPHDNHEIIHSQQTNQSPGKLAPNIPVPIVGDITFKNDFGDTAVGLAHFTQDQGIITILTLAGAFIGSAFGGFPMAGAILLAGLNDIRYAAKQDDKVLPVLPTPIQQSTSLSTPESPSIYSSEVQSMPVNYQQVVERPASTSFTANSNSFEEIEFKEEIPNLPLRLAQDMKNTLIAGVPGSGKGLFVSNALGYVIERGDTTVFYIDPKNDPKESGYFQGRVHKLFRLPKGIIASEPVFVYNWLQKCFAAFHSFDAGNGRKLLVLDEMTSLVKKLANVPAKITGTVKGDKWLEEEIVTCAAAGDSAGATFWGMAQNGHNSGLGMDGGAKSQMTPIAIISLKQLTASQALLRASFVPSDHRLSSDAIKEICERSEVDRAIFHGGLNYWYPMPALPNPSGYNRDDRQFMEGFTSVNETTGNLPESLATTHSVPTLPDARQSYTDEEKRQAEANMVAALRVTAHSTLWEFTRDELGVVSSEEIKNVLAAIADLVFDYELVELKTKFRLSSKNDVRYSYASYRKKIWETHQYTGNICCCCKVKPSEEVHHSRYQGENDKAGVNLYPVCGGRGKNGCHDKLCHSFENWVIDREDLWGSHATPEWEAKLKEGFELLAQGKQ